MSARLQGLTYVIRRQVLSLKLFVPACRVYDSAGKLCFVADQKGAGLRRDLRLYTDEGKHEEALAITARELVEFSAAYRRRGDKHGTEGGSAEAKGPEVDAAR